MVILECEELKVGLSEGVCLLARGSAGLHGYIDAALTQQLGKLIVRHDVLSALATQLVEQLLLTLNDQVQV